jgi:translocation and assembly module TamA
MTARLRHRIGGYRCLSASFALAATLLAAPGLAQTAAETALEQPLDIPALPSGADLPAVEPIIDDAEFDRAIPDLDPQDDPELGLELESITDFERRLAGQEVAEASDQAPGERDGTAPGDDPAIRDTELVGPLPPIEAFEISPVEFAEAAAESETASVAYRIEIIGLDPADAQTPTAMRSMFNSLSALLRGSGRAENAAMIQARLDEDSILMQTILSSQGWYSSRVRTRIAQPNGNERGPLIAVIEVEPGQRYAFSSIEVAAGPTEPPDLISGNFPLRVGEPIVAERVLGAEARIAVALPEHGYPFAVVGDRSIVLDRATGKGDYTLPLETGPRARFGTISTQGTLAFDADHIALLARFERDEIYDSRKVDDLRRALLATGLFSNVSVEPVRTQENADDNTEYVTMQVNQNKGPPRTIAATAGYGTGEGFRLEATWTHRNLFPPEGALTAHGVAGTKEQAAGLTFRRSNAGLRDRTFEIVARGLRSDFDAYRAHTGQLAVQMRRASTPIWQKRFTYALGAELLATSERGFDFRLKRRNRETYYIGGLNGLLGIDFTDDLLDPTRGFRVAALVQPEGAIDGKFNFYVKSQVDTSAYVPLGDNIVLAGRVRLGTIQGIAIDELAPSRRFYAGGGGSVRGFGYKKLGPLDPIGDPVGGRSINEASAEVRYRFGDFGVVGFVDAGQAYAEKLPQFTNIRIGAGIGARYYTNFGPLRIDLATPINRRPGEGRFNLYVSIGQAF